MLMEISQINTDKYLNFRPSSANLSLICNRQINLALQTDGFFYFAGPFSPRRRTLKLTIAEARLVRSNSLVIEFVTYRSLWFGPI